MSFGALARLAAWLLCSVADIVCAYDDLLLSCSIGTVGYGEDDGGERRQSSSATLYSGNYELVEAVSDNKVNDQVSGSSSDGITIIAWLCHM